MPITEAAIRAILATDEETGTVEFKIKSPRPLDLAERICGLANRRSGGTILFGIENKTHQVVGLDRPHENIDVILMALRLVKPTVPLSTPEPEVVTLDGRPLVVLQIAPNNGELYQAGNVFWIRKGSHTVAMTKAEVEAHLLTYGSTRWELLPCRRATLADLDETRIVHYLATRPEPTRRRLEALPRSELLIGLGCAQVDAAEAASDQVRPTQAGMLMFGSDPQFHIPQSEVVCIRYTDSLGAGRYVDRKNLIGNLPALIDQVADFLTLHTLMGGEIRGFKRLDHPEYPLEALREAVVNALVHRDYSKIGETVRVFVYSDRVEVHSPGLLLPGITPLDLAQMRVASHPRNPVLAGLLRDLPGYMERVGSGIRLMITSMRALDLAPPEFLEQHEVVVIFRNGTIPQVDLPAHLNRRQLMGLRIVQDQGSISSPEYTEATGAAPRTALYDLRDMVDKGVLTSRGKKRATRYYLP